MKKILFLVFLLSTNAFALNVSQYKNRPKLVLVLVIDQFRADFLRKFEKSFIPAGNKGEVGGFNFLMENGAFFPNAEYSVLQSMTCPGHAMIMTGSFPRDNGIVLNEWFDKKLNRKVYCAEDEKDKLSPRRLESSTVGDELKNIDKNSKVFALALKDRSSIMLGGHRADLALWVDNEEMKWTSSSYYTNQLPKYVDSENQQLKDKYKISKENSKEAKKDFATYLGVKVTVDMAINMLKNESLGKGESTDILAISFSTHDMTGHSNGADSLEVKAITHVEDREISRLLNEVKKQVGSLDNVSIVLTADHGVAPTTEIAQKNKFDSDKIDYDEVYQKINSRLNNQFGKISKNWLQGHKSFHLYLDNEVLKDKGLDKSQVENEVKNALLDLRGVKQVIISTDIAKGIYPIGVIGEQFKKQYLEKISGDIIIVPKPYFMEKDDNCVTHMTGYSYDRSVPLIITGKNIKKGVYTGADIVDLAPTLSYLLGILPPTTSSGKVLEKIFN